MTRKGARQHPLTMEGYAYVLANAGRVPAREIRRKLRITKNQLESARRKLNRQGANITLRCFRSRLALCPSCGCMRSTTDNRWGICEPCRRARQLAEIQARTAELLARLPEAERALYAETEAETESMADPMPSMPPTRGMSEYQRAKATDEHDRAMERWLATYYRRRVKAAQKRKERIEKKLRNSQESAQF